MTKRRILRRVALSALIFVVLIAFAGYFVLRSRAFHRYALTVMVDRAAQATGGKVQIGDFTFHLSGLRIDLYRIAIHGTEPNAAAPLLYVDHVGVNLKIISLLGRQVGLRTVEIDHPVVHFEVSADGHSNLPAPASSRPPVKSKEWGGPAELFSLAINRFVLRRGEIDVDDRQVPLEATLRHVQTQADFDTREEEYHGLLRYRSGEIQVSHFKPVLHNLDLRFSAGPGELRAEPLVVESGSSRILIRATVKNYSHLSVAGSYSVKLVTADAARALNNATIPAGEIDTTATFSYQSAPNRALLESLSVAGNISSPGLSFRFLEARGRVTALRGRYRLEQGNLTASGIEANVSGGRLIADLAIDDLSGPRRGNLTASVRSLSLAALRTALPDSRWAKFPLRGSLSATAQASWQGNLAALRAHSYATFDGTLGPFAARQPGQSTPVQGTVHVTYDGRAGTLSFQQSVLRTPQSEVSLNGALGAHGALAIGARTSDLHATDILITQVRRFASRSSNSVRALGISGSALFRGTVHGTIERPALKGLLVADHLRVHEAAFPHLQAQVSISPSNLSLSRGELEAARGKARFQASVALRNWAYDPSAPASLQLSVSNLSVADLASLAQVKYPVKGNLSAEISFHGSPSRPVGGGTVEIVKGEAWNQPIQNATLRFSGTGSAVNAALRVKTPAGGVAAHLTYSPQSQAYNGQINLEEVHLDRLHLFEHSRAPVSGILTASIRGHGTLKSPEAQASLSIPALRVGGQTITGVSSQATVANRIGTFTLSSSFAGIPAHVNGSVHLAGDYQADVTISTGKIEAGPLLAAYLPGSPQNLQCQTQLQAWLRGPLKDPLRVEAELQIPVLRLAYQSIHLSSVRAITADYRSGTIVLNPVEMKGTDSDFRLEAMAPLKGNGSLKASASGTIDLHLVEMIDPKWTAAGQLRINVGATGSRSHPKVQGQVEVVNAAIEPPNAPLGVQNMNAIITLADGRAEITRFSAQSGGGSITATGSVAYERGVVFSMGLIADHVRIRYPQGVREVLDSRLRLSGTAESTLISGEVSIEELSLTPAFDLASFANQFNVVSVPPGETTGFTHHVRLNVALRSSRELSLSSTELNLTGAANLRVEGTLADPVIVGRTTLNGGEFFFNQRRYQVESGVIDFLNPVTTQPVVNLRITTTIDQYAITLTFTGPFDRMRTTYSSEPSLSQVDIIHLLITGQAAEAPGTGLGAQSVLAQGVASRVSGRVQKLTGISSLTIDPQMGGNGSNPGARIAVQQRVTKNLFFTFSVDTSTTQDAAVQVQYRINRRWSVQALRNQVGGYSFEVQSHKTF